MIKVAERTDDQVHPDLMTATTRKTRRMLLAVAFISLILSAYPDLQPTKVPFLDVKFANQAQNAELVSGALFLFTLYLLVSFAWYALRDYHHTSTDRLHKIILALFDKQRTIVRVMRAVRAEGGWDNTARLSSILNRFREESGLSYFKFVLAITWIYVGEAKNLLIHRNTIFWVLDFWFPLLLGSLATRVNAEPAMNLVARVLAMF